MSLSVCSAVSDMVRLQRILSACQRCWSLNYFGDAVWMWCIIALKRAMNTTGPLHYMKPNRWLSATCAICRGDLSDFRCNNCQRNDRPNQKQSPPIVITSHFGGPENKGTGKYQILQDGRLHTSVK